MRRVVERIPEGVWLVLIPAGIFLAGYALMIGACVL